MEGISMGHEKLVHCSNCGDEMTTKRVRENNFCSSRCRTAYHRMEEMIDIKYHQALDAINEIGHFMTIRDDLTLRGDDLMAKLTNQIHQYQYRELANKINRLQREQSNN
jgi:hypothetical protein